MTPAFSRRSLLRAAAATAAVGAATPLALRTLTANAALDGQNGLITFNDGGTIYLANADGTNPRVLATGANPGAPTWAPDGSRIVYAAGSRLRSVRPDGTGLLDLTDMTGGPHYFPTFAPWGGDIVFSNNGVLSIVSADGVWLNTSPVFDSPPPTRDEHPTIAPNGTLVFDRGDKGAPKDIYRWQSRTLATKIIDNGWGPDFSPDGQKIAFVRSDLAQNVHQIWVANADGTGQTQLTLPDQHGTHNIDPKWAPDGTSILFTSVKDDAGTVRPVLRISPGGGNADQVVASGDWPTWQPLNTDTVRRVWGQSQIETAIATSRYLYADHGVTDRRLPAQAVVLSRSDLYYDALGGSALAIVKHGPLLITPNNALHAGVEAEIKRVLGSSGTVYVLGGELALPASIANRLTSLGFTVKRIWGVSHFQTAIAIARAITDKPKQVIIATGHMYYDALAAGAAAGNWQDTVIVLVDGNSMPAETAAYLNALNPDPETGTWIIAAGGWAERALLSASDAGRLPSWPAEFWYFPLVGHTAEDTAIRVAEFFFDGPWNAAVATTASWFDALAGGAMIGGAGGPLLLTAPNGVYPGVRDYLSANSGALRETVILGGPLALPGSLVAPIGNAIALPGHWVSSETTDKSSAAFAATTAQARVDAKVRAQAKPGAGATRPARTATRIKR